MKKTDFMNGGDVIIFDSCHRDFFAIRLLYPVAALILMGTIIYAIVSSADLRRKDK